MTTTDEAPTLAAAYDWKPAPSVAIAVYGLAGPQGSKTPVGWGKSRTTGKAIPLMRESSKKVKPWREQVTAVLQAALAAGAAQRIAGPVLADITFTMPKPASHPKRRRTYPAVSPDIDKLERSTYDAITASGAWEDDGRVIESRTRKVYPGEHPDALDQPGAVIRLYTLGESS